jgi:exodeoxyribonuclease III
MSICIATYNVNSVKARLPLILDWAKDAKPDVLCLQELKCLDEAFPRDDFESLGYQIITHGQKSYNGVAILSKYPFMDVKKGLGIEALDSQSRYIEAVIEAPLIVRVGCLYAPNGNPVGTEKYEYKQAWLNQFRTHARSLLDLEENVILCGDYNIIPEALDCHRESVWIGDALYQPQTRAQFRALKNMGYVDAFEAKPDLDNRYTFWDYQAGAWPKNEGIRIDHHLLSPYAADRLIGVKIHKNARGAVHESAKPSDHVPVSIELLTKN